MRGRLIAGLLALLTVASAAVGLTSYYAIKGAIFRQENSQLQIATNLAYKCQDPHIGDDDDDDHAGRSRNSQGPGQDSSAAGKTVSGKTASGKTGSGKTVPGHPNWSSGASLDCPGLGTGTLAVSIVHGTWAASLVPDTSCVLSAADRRTLSYLTPTAPPSAQRDAPTAVRSLKSADGDYELTSIRDPDGDGSVYITGLPLRSVYHTLRNVALTEMVIFAAVLAVAGAGGTLWVRLSLRPLSRVASTAATVAELPLETGEVELPAGVPDTDPATETGQVGAAFNRMLGHVQEALERRAASEMRLRRFAADASHELRTPLAAIRGYAELALRHPGDAPQDVTHALRRVLSESTRMSVLVDDLLLLARLDAGRPLDRAPVDMSRLVIDATSDARVAHGDHRWVLDLPDDPVEVRGDDHRLHQVLANLLSNAGRHTPAGTTVTVAISDGALSDGAISDGKGPVSAAPVTVTAPGEGYEVRRGTVPPEPRAVIAVTDDGPGIAPDLMPDLFERFTRADTARSHAADADASAHSTGLGLAIVDAVVTSLGGAVLAVSRPGMTRFSIILPRLPAPADAWSYLES
jgi:two-component system OmpR family sensor kinase